MKRSSLANIIVLLARALACACTLLTACQSWSYPPIEDMLLDESAFPVGWSVSTDGADPIPRAPWTGSTNVVENVELYFYAYGGGALERIWRFMSSEDASQAFEHQMRYVFRNGEFNTPWAVPAELSYHSSVASQFHYACATFDGQPSPGCAYVAQYGVHVVHFQTSMLPGLMTYSDLENVLQAIDERMAQYTDGR
jgi:hypothetical protein